MVKRIFTLILLLCSSTAFASGLFSATGQSQFLPADQAFAFDYQQQGQQLALSWTIAPGYYLYRKQIEVTAQDASLAPLTLPAGLPHEDEFFGKTQIYSDQLELPVTINQAQAGAVVSVTYQGCASAGFCYPPTTQQITLYAVAAQTSSAGNGSAVNNNAIDNNVADHSATHHRAVNQGVMNNGLMHGGDILHRPEMHQEGADNAPASNATGSNAPVNNTDINNTSASASNTSASQSATDSHSGQLPFNPLWALLIGIGIAFTPCVLPMYPLISGIVLGGKQRLSGARALWLSLVYVQGMAVTYTLLGMVVALAGLQFQAAFQSPWLLMTLSVIFILLALSMFGLFTLQLPSSLQTRLALLSNRQQGGSAGGVFCMGAIGGLICSPCTTAPLSAILLYIAQSGNLWQGGGTLYLYALGMGLPLILVTVFGNRLLPRSGAWMQQVKTGFGFVILALPVFLLERVVGADIGQLLWSLLGMAFFIWLFIISLPSSHPRMRLVQICCLAAALVVARPVQDWLFGAPAALENAATSLTFRQIHSTTQLDQALADAKGKPVMLDLYADWCVACKEFEKYTFTDAKVQQALANTVLLQIDMTRNSAENSALLKQLQVLGLPTILFFNGQGVEQTQQRVTGFMDAGDFLAHLAQTLAENHATLSAEASPAETLSAETLPASSSPASS